MEESSEVYRRNKNVPKTRLCSSLGTTFTSLVRQLSTITCCDRFDTKHLDRQHKTSNAHRAELTENPQMVYAIKCCKEINLHDPSLVLRTLHFAVYGTHMKVHHRYPHLSDNQTGWLKHTTVFHKPLETNQH